MPSHTIRWMFAVACAGCIQSPPGSPTDDPLEPKTLSPEECKARDGTIVGDTGDGATHRPDYVCTSGKAPLGDIVLANNEPFGIEGAVCCPR